MRWPPEQLKLLSIPRNDSCPKIEIPGAHVTGRHRCSEALLVVAQRLHRPVTLDGDAGHSRAKLGESTLPFVGLTRLAEAQKERSDGRAVRAQYRGGIPGLDPMRQT